MNRISLVVAVVGVVICLIGVGLFVFSGDKFDDIEESQQYEGKGGKMKLEGYSKGGWLIVTMEGNYANGRSAIYEDGRNVSLTEKDCDLVNNFTLRSEGGDEYFIPTCENSDDTTEDGWIHIGVICDSEGKYSNYTEGCPDGTYTWDTNGTLINVWDGIAIIEGIMGGLAALGSGLFACCCGGVVVIIGIILAFTMEDSQAQTFDTSSNHPLINSKDDGFTTYEKKGWDEQEDYIRKDTSEDETTKEEETKKDRSGEYELPPPP